MKVRLPCQTAEQTIDSQLQHMSNCDNVMLKTATLTEGIDPHARIFQTTACPS